MVHYDPKNPSNAVLDVRIAQGVTLIVVAMAFFGFAVFFSGVFRLAAGREKRRLCGFCHRKAWG